MKSTAPPIGPTTVGFASRYTVQVLHGEIDEFPQVVPDEWIAKVPVGSFRVGVKHPVRV